MNNISGRKNTPQAKLKGESQNERIDKWKEHFSNLLGKTPNVIDEEIKTVIDHKLPIKKGLFSMSDELEKDIKKTKNNKAAGLDGIPPELWKTGRFNDYLLNFCNDVYQQNKISVWTKGCILPFPKKSDLSLPDNYRGITLTCIASKIYNSLLRDRILPELEKVLRQNQNGFRPNRSTQGQILTIRRLLEGVKAKNLQATIIFVDFFKAFDSVHRG